MQYRTIGQTGLRVSEIGFGCGNNAALMVKASHEDQVKAVRHALDQGINFFDTAFAYGWGKSEENLGTRCQSGNLHNYMGLGEAEAGKNVKVANDSRRRGRIGETEKRARGFCSVAYASYVKTPHW